MAGNRLINFRELRREVELNGSTLTANRMIGLLEKKTVRPHDFSLREVATAFMGREWVENLHPKWGRFAEHTALLEADGSAVSYADFSNITGQIFFNAVQQSYEYDSANFPFSQVIPTKPTDILDMEKIPGISEVGDEFTVIGEAEEYPNFGVSEDYIEVAAKAKRGGIVPVTKEAILGDKTGDLLTRCKNLGFWLYMNKETRLVDCLIDENAGAVSAALQGHRYHWKGTSYATYQTSTPWDNVATSNGLVDESDLEQAWLTMVAITDPYTGHPINQKPTHLIVTPQNLMAAHRALRATEVRTHAGGYPTSGNPLETASPPGLRGVPELQNLTILYSQLLASRAATDTDWWLGAPGKAFAYYSVWNVEPEEQGKDSEAGFRRDVVMEFKVSEMGAAATENPRFMVESRA